MPTTRPDASREAAPLLGARVGPGDTNITRTSTKHGFSEKKRFAVLNSVVFAVFVVGVLCVFAGDALGALPGVTPHTTRTSQVSQRSRLSDPALTPEFVALLNNRVDKTWQARVPKGMESATHADLKRLSGGRLSGKPKDGKKGWRQSEFATKLTTDRSATANEFTNEMRAASQTHVTNVRGERGAFQAAARMGKQSRAPSARLGSVVRKFGLSGKLGGFIEDFLGGGSSSHQGGAEGALVEFDPRKQGLPESFDTRDKWPQCAALIGRARDQGNCGSCWAMAPAEVMSDRLCVQTNGLVVEELSPFVLMACATGFGAAGCDGGESSVAYEYAKSAGVVTGAAFGDDKTCAPYPFEACHHPCSVFPTPACPSECVVGNSVERDVDETAETAVSSGQDVAALGVEKSVSVGVEHGGNKHSHQSHQFQKANDVAKVGDMNTKVKVAQITSCPTFDYACIAEELFRYGPVSSYAGDIYEEFYAYADGVFRESTDVSLRGDNHGGHVIKIIGWGREESSGEYYWIIVNSWLNWGQEGVGKIAVGQVGLGAGVEAAVMEIPAGVEVLPSVPEQNGEADGK